jgi:hypothetical protein
MNTYKDNVIEHFELPGLLHMIEKIVNFKSEEFFKKKFIPVLSNFYELNSQILKSIMSKIPIDDPIDMTLWMNPQNQILRFKDQVHCLDNFCEEVSDISNQTELFKNHLIKIMFVDGDSEILRKAREHDKHD